MDIPPSRKREFHEKEIAFINDALRVSGLDSSSITAAWEPHWVTFNGIVRIEPVLFDCHGWLDTPCWIVRRISTPDSSQTCACGQLVRDAVTGSYGTLREAVATAIGEVVRSRVLAAIPDSAEPIFKERHAGQQAPGCNDFMTHCMHS